MEIPPFSYPDSLFASCGYLLYPYRDGLPHSWRLSPSLTDDVSVRHTALTNDKGTTSGKRVADIRKTVRNKPAYAR